MSVSISSLLLRSLKEDLIQMDFDSLPKNNTKIEVPGFTEVAIKSFKSGVLVGLFKGIKNQKLFCIGTRKVEEDQWKLVDIKEKIIEVKKFDVSYSIIVLNVITEDANIIGIHDNLLFTSKQKSGDKYFTSFTELVKMEYPIEVDSIIDYKYIFNRKNGKWCNYSIIQREQNSFLLISNPDINLYKLQKIDNCFTLGGDGSLIANLTESQFCLKYPLNHKPIFVKQFETVLLALFQIDKYRYSISYKNQDEKWKLFNINEKIKSICKVEFSCIDSCFTWNFICRLKEKKEVATPCVIHSAIPSSDLYSLMKEANHKKVEYPIEIDFITDYKYTFNRDFSTWCDYSIIQREQNNFLLISNPDINLYKLQKIDNSLRLDYNGNLIDEFEENLYNGTKQFKEISYFVTSINVVSHKPGNYFPVFAISCSVSIPEMLVNGEKVKVDCDRYITLVPANCYHISIPITSTIIPRLKLKSAIFKYPIEIDGNILFAPYFKECTSQSLSEKILPTPYAEINQPSKQEKFCSGNIKYSNIKRLNNISKLLFSKQSTSFCITQNFVPISPNSVPYYKIHGDCVEKKMIFNCPDQSPNGYLPTGCSTITEGSLDTYQNNKLGEVSIGTVISNTSIKIIGSNSSNTISTVENLEEVDLLLTSPCESLLPEQLGSAYSVVFEDEQIPVENVIRLVSTMYDFKTITQQQISTKQKIISAFDSSKIQLQTVFTEIKKNMDKIISALDSYKTESNINLPDYSNISPKDDNDLYESWANPRNCLILNSFVNETTTISFPFEKKCEMDEKVHKILLPVSKLLEDVVDDKPLNGEEILNFVKSLLEFVEINSLAPDNMIEMMFAEIFKLFGETLNLSMISYIITLFSGKQSSFIDVISFMLSIAPTQNCAIEEFNNSKGRILSSEGGIINKVLYYVGRVSGFIGILLASAGIFSKIGRNDNPLTPTNWREYLENDTNLWTSTTKCCEGILPSVTSGFMFIASLVGLIEFGQKNKWNFSFSDIESIKNTIQMVSRLVSTVVHFSLIVLPFFGTLKYWSSSLLTVSALVNLSTSEISNYCIHIPAILFHLSKIVSSYDSGRGKIFVLFFGLWRAFFYAWAHGIVTIL